MSGNPVLSVGGADVLSLGVGDDVLSIGPAPSPPPRRPWRQRRCARRHR